MRRILGVIICCFVVATAYIAYVIAERQTALQKFSRYNDSGLLVRLFQNICDLSMFSLDMR